MALTPCQVCGHTPFSAPLTTVLHAGEPHLRYAGPCPRCGTGREFVFRAPDPIVPEATTVVFGGPEPSEVIDPGDWMRVFEFAEHATGLSGDDYLYAAAALDEVRKFIPPDADEVPAAAFRSDRTLAVHAREPGRFRRDRLIAMAGLYRQLAAEAADAEAGGGEAADVKAGGEAAGA